MSQWKGPFKELYEWSLEKGASDIVKEAKSLRKEFIKAATDDGMSKKAANAFYDSFMDRLKTKKDHVVEDRPYDRDLLMKVN